MDKVFISQLHVDTIIGVYDFEKESKQSLYFDIEMLSDIKPAAENDDINLALDYSKVSERVIKHCTAKPVELNLAGRQELLRVPGIGPKGANAILSARRRGILRSVEDLRKIGLNPSRALPFILLDGKSLQYQMSLF